MTLMTGSGKEQNNDKNKGRAPMSHLQVHTDSWLPDQHAPDMDMSDESSGGPGVC